MRFEDAILTDPHTANTGTVLLRAGPLVMRFEPTTTFLRGLKYGDAEVLRAVYGAVRDSSWGTVPPVVSNLDVKQSADAFRLTFGAACRQGEIDFVWRGEITGGADGTVRYAFRGEAGTTFLRNRIGLCVLHPLRECAGKDCTVETTGGAVVPGEFPSLVAPHQPFRDVRALSYSPLPGVDAEVRFEGDTFETEDQRNWTDASFKTYSTPLDLPSPVEVEAGTVVGQAVTLTLRGKPRRSRAAKRDDGVVAMKLRGPSTARTTPALGLGVAGHGKPVTRREQALLSKLHPQHLRADVTLYKPDWREALERARQGCAALQVPLECALHVGENAEAELRECCLQIARSGLPVTSIVVYPARDAVTDAGLMRATWRAALNGLGYGLSVFGGTDANFAELNRTPPRFVAEFPRCFAANPQVHATDDASVMENLEGLTHAVTSAHDLAGHLHVAVTPVTLKPRFNAAAAMPAAMTPPGELPPDVDVRQMSLFGAAWTLGAIAALHEAGAHSATLFETTGWRGVMETEQGSPLPERFPSLPGAAFPLYHVLADVGAFAGGNGRAFMTETPGRAAALLLKTGQKTAILCANLTPETQAVRLTNLPDNRGWALRLLHADNAEHAMREPETFRADWGRPVVADRNTLELELPPYACAAVHSAGVKP